MTGWTLPQPHLGTPAGTSGTGGWYYWHRVFRIVSAESVGNKPQPDCSELLRQLLRIRSQSIYDIRWEPDPHRPRKQASTAWASMKRPRWCPARLAAVRDRRRHRCPSTLGGEPGQGCCTSHDEARLPRSVESLHASILMAGRHRCRPWLG